MKKLFYVAVAAIILPFAFFSCGEDDNVNLIEKRTYTVRDLHGLWGLQNDSFNLWFVCDTTYEETNGRLAMFYYYAPSWTYTNEMDGGTQEMFCPTWNTAEIKHSGDSGTILFKEFPTSQNFYFINPYWEMTPYVIANPTTISYKFVTDSTMTVWVSKCETTAPLKSVGLKRTLKKQSWQYNILLYDGCNEVSAEYEAPKWN